MKNYNILALFAIILPLIVFLPSGHAQIFEVEGNGVFKDSLACRITLKSLEKNALIRFGDITESKVSLGYQVDDDLFSLSEGSQLSNQGLTMGLSTNKNKFALNDLPSIHRFLITHNSTSGPGGSAHLTLLENDDDGLARIRFTNTNTNDYWTQAVRAEDNNAVMNFYYHDGIDGTNILSIDGDAHRVGIHKTNPEAYLHLKQETSGVDVLKFENDDQTGGETWGFRVGDNDILIYYEGGIRGSFDDVDGAYTNFPPPAALSRSQKKPVASVLEQVKSLPLGMQVKNDSKRLELNPYELIKTHPEWVVQSEDGEHLGIDHAHFSAVALKALQEQQLLLEEFAEKIKKLEELVNN